MAISYLPQEILTDIFLRLPIETLSNVILVNKSCLQLITSSHFAKAHLKISKQGKTNLSDCRFIFDFSPDGLVLEQFSFESLLFNCSSINVVDLNYPEPGRGELHLLGSCDGLVCFEKEKVVFLWNSCTGKYKKLPCLNVDYNVKKYVDVTYAFGYDESTDDYKVVALTSSSNGVEEMYAVVVNVFSLKRNSWKLILHDFVCISHLNFGKLVSGKIHWTVYYNENHGPDILSFDIESEVFDKVEQPSYGDGNFVMQLDMLEGCLSLLLIYGQPPRIDLWVMKEYGVKESWTKVVTLSRVNIPIYVYYGAMMLSNGEILLRNIESSEIYNPKDGSFRFSSIVRLTCSPKPTMYAQSLVSPVAV